MIGYGVVQPSGGPPRVAARAGEAALDLAAAARAGLFDDRFPEARAVFAAPALNPFLASGRSTWSAVLARVRELLADPELPGVELLPLAAVTPLRPFAPGDYVDFYSSLEHATNLGRMFRPDAEPLLPNWRHAPVGYHGRAGTVAVTGTPVRRPWGQLPPGPGERAPRFAPTERLDFELELGWVTGGSPTALGDPVPPDAVREHVFGVVLVNDWSARDIQRWEYVPLGPFLGKSFATSVSAWVTPLELLEPLRVPAPQQEPEPLPHLRVREDWGLDLALEVELNGTVVSRTSAAGLYWTIPQQLAHATSNGATIRPGDLWASGTISGSERGTEGSLIELSRNGQEPLRLADNTTRSFLQDGDTVVLRGAGGRAEDRVELGAVAGTVQAARRADRPPSGRQRDAPE